jgi:hypothetical protein
MLRSCANRASIREAAFGIERLDLADEFLMAGSRKIVGSLRVPEIGMVDLAVGCSRPSSARIELLQGRESACM